MYVLVPLKAKMGLRETCRSWLFRPQATELFQIVVGFTAGLIMGPLSAGSFATMLLFIALYEAFLLWTTEMLLPYWRFTFRVTANCAYFIGWILGRWLLLDEIGVLHLSGLPQRVYAQHFAK